MKKKPNKTDTVAKLKSEIRQLKEDSHDLEATVTYLRRELSHAQKLIGELFCDVRNDEEFL